MPLKNFKNSYFEKIIEILNERKITRIDWLATDSNGLDIGLFNHLDVKLIEDISLIEIMGLKVKSCKDLDKVYSFFKFLRKNPKQILNLYLENNFFNRRDDNDEIEGGLVNAVFINPFVIDRISLREVLLMSAILLMNKRFADVMELCTRAMKRFNDAIFLEINNSIGKETGSYDLKTGYKNFILKIKNSNIIRYLKITAKLLLFRIKKRIN